ncbi:hypothetical protein APHAL10511_007696 [Amanita phalloides]|nr:hypothetical protein APHAL10511_007696 [Amanita phalloides]
MDNGKAAREVTNVVELPREYGNASGMKNELSEPMSRSTVTTHELSHSPSASDVRSILGPLIASNAQARINALGKDTLPAEPQGGIQGLLTDEICDRFAEQMRDVEGEEELSSSNGLSSMNEKKIPKAPRAMLMRGAVRAGDALRKQDRTNTKNPRLNLRIPITIPLPTTPANSQAAALPIPSSAPAGEGTAVPLDSKEPEEGEIMGSSPSSRTPSHAVRQTSPLKSCYTYGRKYSISPEPAPHRLPTSRTYRSRSPSEGSYRHTSRSSRSPQLLRYSQSPIHTRRQSSFPDDLRGPSSPPRRVRKRSRSRAIPRPSEPTSPVSLRSATHERRGSNYDTRLGKNEPHSWKDNGYPDKSLTSEEKDHARSVNGGVTPLDHHTSDRERRRSSTQSREFDAGSTRPKVPTRSISLSNSKPNHQVDIIALDRTTPPDGIQNNVFDTKLTASPLSMMTPLPGTAECGLSPHDQVQVGKPCHEVPGLWMIKAGGSSVEIVTCEFEIDKVTADRWGIGSSRHGEEKARDALSLSLVCIPLSDAAVRAKLDVTFATRQELMNEITRIEAVWPPAGHLVVEINPDHDWGRSWLPRHLRKEHASVDITHHVHEGMNIIRLIQLASLADCIFVILAKEKPPNVGVKDLEPAADIGEVEVDEPQTTEQLLASFQTSTRIIYS